MFLLGVCLPFDLTPIIFGAGLAGLICCCYYYSKLFTNGNGGLGIGDWELGIGNWELGIGHC